MTSLEKYLLQFFRKSLRYYKAIITSFIIVITATVIYTSYCTPLYVSQASFFLASNKGSGATFGGYASLLGLSALGGKSGEAMIVDILKSRRIRTHVATIFRPDFEKEIHNQSRQHPMSESQINEFVIGHLKLGKHLLFDYSPGKFSIIISYKNTNPELAQKVLQAYLEYLNIINEELELSAEKELIKVLDAPSLPRSPSSPNRKKNLTRSIALLTFFWGILIGYGVLRDRSKNQDFK